MEIAKKKKKKSIVVTIGKLNDWDRGASWRRINSAPKIGNSAGAHLCRYILNQQGDSTSLTHRELVPMSFAESLLF